MHTTSPMQQLQEALIRLGTTEEEQNRNLALHEALQTLFTEDRISFEIVHLRYMEDRTLAEIGKIFPLSMDQIRYRLETGKARLKQILGPPPGR